MRRFKRIELTMVLLSGLWLIGYEPTSKNDQPLNVLMISIDDLNDWVGV